MVVWEGRPVRGVPIPMCAGQIRLLGGDVNIRKEMTHEVNKVQTQPDQPKRHLLQSEDGTRSAKLTA